ncbi:MAG: hypothetical protein Q8S84_07675 [bacterium]|nr:hypothetical protein [bacterium]MDP3381322.1 hypothetical protein [bacterium]
MYLSFMKSFCSLSLFSGVIAQVYIHAAIQLFIKSSYTSFTDFLDAQYIIHTPGVFSNISATFCIFSSLFDISLTIIDMFFLSNQLVKIL